MSRFIELQALASLLTSALQGLSIRVDRADDLPDSTTTEELADVHLVLIKGHGAYPAGIDVFAFPRRDEPRVHVALARFLSTLRNCDAVCDETPYAPKNPGTGDTGALPHITSRA